MRTEDFAQAYVKSYPTTVKFLNMRGVVRETAEEIASDAWVKAWRYRMSYRPELGAVVTWVERIAWRVWMEHLSRNRIETEPLSAFHLRTVRSMCDLSAIDARRILSLCAPRHRKALHDYYITGETYFATTNAERKRLFHARNEARAIISRRLP